jgi:hypothetical protein
MKDAVQNDDEIHKLSIEANFEGDMNPEARAKHEELRKSQSTSVLPICRVMALTMFR